MKDLEKVATSNAEDNVTNEVTNNNSFKKYKMTNEKMGAPKNAKEDFKFDFESLFARDEAPVTMTQERVTEISRYMESPKLSSVTLSFHQRNKGRFYLKLEFNMDSISKIIWTPADEDLAYSVMCAMRGKMELLNSYKVKEHTVLQTTDNIVVELFKRFMATRIRKRIVGEFQEEGITRQGITFNLAEERVVMMWVELTDEVKNIIEDACFGKA